MQSVTSRLHARRRVIYRRSIDNDCRSLFSLRISAFLPSGTKTI